MMRKPLNKFSPPEGGVPAKGGGGGFEEAIKNHNLPYLKVYRKKLRNNLTSAEARLWSLIKNKQLQGRKFRRQHSIGNFIIDFFCLSEKLAIELDGNDHFKPDNEDRDIERDKILSRLGITVLRFENKWIWEDHEWVLEKITSSFKPPRPPKADTPPERRGDSS